MKKNTCYQASFLDACALFLFLILSSALLARPSFTSTKFVEKKDGLINKTSKKTHELRVFKNCFDQIPVITADENYFCGGYSLLLTSSPAATYQWYKDGVLITSATLQEYAASENGIYTVITNYGEGSDAVSPGFQVHQANIWLGTANDGDWSNTLNWSCGEVPTSADHVVVTASIHPPTISGISVITIQHLSLEASALLTVADGSTLRVIDAIEVPASAALILQDESSLLQVNADAVNTGNITAKKTTSPMKRYDYTYWSSPVTGQTLYNLSPFTMIDKYYSFSPAIGNWVSHLYGNATMEAGKGYIIRAPQSFSATLATPYSDGLFIGTPNNGDIMVPITVGISDMNLIGNPYPSAIDMDLFLLDAGNAATTGGTIYLWTHHSAPALIEGDNIYNYTSNDYASYNLLGGVATTSGNTEKPTGKVASGQSFFIHGIASGQAVFNNSMRVANSNDQFFRGNTSVNTIEKHRLWLNLTNSEGAFKQTLVGFMDGATDATDRNVDGIDFNGNAFVNLYTIANDTHYTIQGRALPFDSNVNIALGYSTTVAGTFQFGLDDFDGLFETQEVYLYDSLYDSYTNIKNGVYEFTTLDGTFNNRFELRFNNPMLATQNFNAANLTAAYNDGILKIRATEMITSVVIYDIAGRTIFTKEGVNSKEIMLSDLNPRLNTVALVQIKLGNGQTIVRKAILD
jgi:hypothetical protein